MRIFTAATVLSVGTVAFLALAAPRLYTGYHEREVRRALVEATAGDTLDRRVQQAIEDGDIGAAVQYRELAGELGRPLSPESLKALEDAQSTVNTFVRNAGDFAGAYITGRADSAAGLAGAVVSDLTVVGDVRDIVTEGGKAALGEDYSKFLLTLAAIGLAAEGATIATGGTSLVAKAALSILKVAKRTGNLTVAFTTRLMRLAEAAVQSVPAAARAADGATAPARLARSAARAELATTLGAIDTVARNAGAADAVKLMRFVRTPEDARELATFTSRFGRRSRAVAELTGKTALRAFRVSLRGLRLLFAFVWSFLAWLAGLVGLRVLKRLAAWVLDAFRAAFLAVALP